VSTVTELEEYKAAKLPPFRLGTLKVEGQRLRLTCDASLTAGAARTLAAQLLVLADSIEVKRG